MIFSKTLVYVSLRMGHCKVGETGTGGVEGYGERRKQGTFVARVFGILVFFFLLRAGAGLGSMRGLQLELTFRELYFLFCYGDACG